ncbi:tripartite tricarboxylate transporter permease [Pseudochelatococcus sp. B33]
MDLYSSLLLGFGTALSATNLIFCFIGTLLGTLIGVLPGIGPLATIAMLLPITVTLEPTTALIMLAGIYYGAQYGGSTTAILMNLPGEAASAVTALDGYQLARQGRAGPALAVAALASLFAGTVSTVFIALFAPILTVAALQFGAPEYFSLMVLGLVGSVALARQSVLKAISMIVLGLLIGIVGTDIYSGAWRFTFGFNALADGIDIVPVAIGLYGIAEILRNLEHEYAEQGTLRQIGRLMPSRLEARRSVGPAVRGTLLGSFLGVLPGGGALLSSFASYAVEKRISRVPEQFGKGAIEGVAGPEAANNAGAQTSFIPMLTLGIPGNAITAMMIGAMIIQGIVPGPEVIQRQPELFWGLVASMWIGNLMLVILNLPLVGLWVRVISAPYYIVFPAVIIFSAIGCYAIANSTIDVVWISVFSVVGYIFYRLDCDPTPFILGFILGPMMEENLRRAMIFSRGDPMIFLTSPISLVELVLAFLLLIMLTRPAITRKRREVFKEE